MTAGGAAIPLASSGECYSASVQWLLLARMPPLESADLATCTRLVTRPGSEHVLLPTLQLTRQARVLWPEDVSSAVRNLRVSLPDDHADVAAARGALPAGVTVGFALDDAGAGALAARGETHRSRVTVLLHRPVGVEGGGVQLALLMEGRDATDSPAPTGAEGPDAREEGETGDLAPRTELVVLEGTLRADGRSVVLLLPWGFSSGTARAVAAIVTVSRPPRPGTTAAEQHADAVDRYRQQVAPVARPETAGLAARAGVTSAFSGLASPSTRRASLCALALLTAAPMAGDFALSASDALLADLEASLREQVAARGDRDVEGELPVDAPDTEGPVFDGPELGFLLERAALTLLAEAASGDTPDAALEAILLRHAGESGRSPNHLLRLSARAEGLAALHGLFVDENLVYLEDPSPASRVRAFDWLARRGLAPDGFEPLAPVAERWAAMKRWREEHDG
jgi:hypothetical protein